MFAFVRTHNRLLQAALLFLIFPAFVFWGLESYASFASQSRSLASVDGQDISQTDFERAHRSQIEQARASRPDLSDEMLNSPQARSATLERQIHAMMLRTAARQARLVTSDARLETALMQNPQIQALKRADGSFDLAGYQQSLANSGLTAATFESSLRRDLAADQLTRGITASSLMVSALSDLALEAYLQRREVQYRRFVNKDFAKEVKIDEAALKAFYDKNRQRFEMPEVAAVEYVEINAESLRGTMNLSSADLRAYYQAHRDQFIAPEERRARHILFAFEKNDKTKAAQALAQARSVLAQLQKNPQSFAELAKKFSQDPGSAAQGGDLGFFGRGAMTPPFEQAVFALKPGQISDIVESDFGFHIIALEAVRGGAQRSFEQVQGEIRDALLKDKTQERFNQLAAEFQNRARAGDLRALAEHFHLSVQRATLTGRQPAQGGALGNAEFLAALFEKAPVPGSAQKTALPLTPATLIDANDLAVGRLLSITPAHTEEFASAREKVRQALIAQEAPRLARAAAEASVKKWEKERSTLPASAGFSAPVIVARDQQIPELARPVIEEALRANAEQLPQMPQMRLVAAPGGFVALRVLKALPRLAKPQENERDLEDLRQAFGQAEALAYLAALPDHFHVRRSTRQP